MHVHAVSIHVCACSHTRTLTEQCLQVHLILIVCRNQRVCRHVPREEILSLSVRADGICRMCTRIPCGMRHVSGMRWHSCYLFSCPMACARGSAPRFPRIADFGGSRKAKPETAGNRYGACSACAHHCAFHVRYACCLPCCACACDAHERPAGINPAHSTLPVGFGAG